VPVAVSRVYSRPASSVRLIPPLMTVTSSLPGCGSDPSTKERRPSGTKVSVTALPGSCPTYPWTVRPATPRSRTSARRALKFGRGGSGASVSGAA